MKGSILKTRSKGQTDLARLRRLKDDEIDFSDIPKLSPAFWKGARLTLPESKDRITMRLDRDVVTWMKSQGPGYQTRINAVLRSWMEAHTSAR